MSWEDKDSSRLEDIAASLDQLASAAQINLLYSAAERRRLGTQYNELREACETAKATFDQAQLPNGMTWDDYEQSAAPQEVAAVKVLAGRIREGKQAADRDFHAFRKAHPLLVRVLDQRRDWT